MSSATSNAPAKAGADQHNLRIDALRFVAASLVVLYHCQLVIGPAVASDTKDPLRVWIAHGQTGVSLFLVLSGFLFGRLAFVDPNREIIYSRFILNRVLRIWPLLIFLLLVGGSIIRAEVKPDFWLSVVFLAFDHESVRGIDLFGPLWTIGVEFRFYLLFPLLVVAFGPRKRMWLGLIAVMILMRAIIVIAYHGYWDWFYFTFLGRFDQLLLGVLLALSFDWLKAVGGKVLPVIGLVVGVVALTSYFFYVVRLHGEESKPWLMVLATPIEALGWATILFSVIEFPWGLGIVERFFAKIGTWSYSMYLLHISVVHALRKLGKFSIVEHNDELNVLLNGLLIVLPAVIALSALTYTIIEAPFLRMRVKYFRPRATEPSATT